MKQAVNYHYIFKAYINFFFWNEDKIQFDENFARSIVKYQEKLVKWSKDKVEFLKE